MRRLLLIAPVVVVLAIVAGVVVVLAQAQSVPVADDWEGRIVVVNEGSLVLHEPGSSRVVVEATGSTFVQSAAFDRDGEAILYSQAELPSRTNQLTWTAGDLWRWTPDGNSTRIVSHEREGEILVHPRRVGDRLMLESSYPVLEDGRYVDQRDEIILVDPETGEREVVVEHGKEPSPSADGRLIAYIDIDPLTYRERLKVFDTEAGESDQMLEDDSGLTWVHNPALSPDGRYLLFSAAGQPRRTADSGGSWWNPFQPRVAEAHGPPQDIWMIDLDTGERTQLTDLLIDDPAATWSPDGAMVAVYGPPGIHLVDPATLEVERITRDGGWGTIDWWKP